MNIARAALLALIALGVSAGALAQWKWRDRDGVVQYSDLPPPKDTPQKDILDMPKIFAKPRAASAPGGAASAASAVQAGGAAPRGLEAELEARRRQAEVEKAEKTAKDSAARQAENARVEALRADNCRRARSALRTLDEGVRIARTNEKGEREIYDDRMRAEESARLRGVIAADCAANR